MSALSAHVAERDLSADPRNAALDAFSAMLEGAVNFAKAQDCEAQLRRIVKGLLPDPEPVSDLFSAPTVSMPLDANGELEFTTLQKAFSRLSKLKLSAVEHAGIARARTWIEAQLEAAKKARKA